MPNQHQNQQQLQREQQKDVKEDEEEKNKAQDRWTYDQSKCIVNLSCEKLDIWNSSQCNQAWSSIKTEVGKYGNSKSVIQSKNKNKALKDQYKKAKGNNRKSGQEPKSSPCYNHFNRILSERQFLLCLSLKKSDKKL